MCQASPAADFAASFPCRPSVDVARVESFVQESNAKIVLRLSVSEHFQLDFVLNTFTIVVSPQGARATIPRKN